MTLNKKLIFVLALLILAVISVSIVTAVNNGSDSLATDDNADEKISQDVNTKALADDNAPVAAGGLTVKKVWKDNDDSKGKRPASIKFSIIENGQVIEKGCEITESMGWKATLDFAVRADSTYEIVEEDVPEGYKANVTGNVEDGFVITNTLKDVPKNNTDNNNTHPDNNNTHNPVVKNVTKKVTKVKDKHNTGNPILLGALALSATSFVIQLRRKE